MKKMMIVVGLGLMGAGTAFAQTGTTRVEIPVQTLLTPEKGFEEKNNIQAVLYGYLPNQCYTLSNYEVRTQPSGDILVRQFAIHDTTGVCANEQSMPAHMQMIVPFTTEVSIGHLFAGIHTLDYDTSSGMKTRPVDISTNVSPNVDTLPYAAVTAAIAPDMMNGADPVKVTVTGFLNSTCTSLDPVVQVMRENDVFVLLPTIKVKVDEFCAQVMIPFEKEVNLGKTFPGIHLIHVRSMNGRSVNKVVVVAK